MNFNKFIRCLFIAVLIGYSASDASAGGLAEYTIIDLGTLGGTYSYANGINDAGQVVGYSPTVNSEEHATLFNVSGTTVTPIDLGTIGGDYSYAYGINDAGQVVGSSFYMSSNVRHATLFNASGTTVTRTDLGTLGGGSSGAFGINDAGQVVGYSYTSGNGGQHATLFNVSGTIVTHIDLGTIGGDYSYAYGINDAGQVVGVSSTNGSNSEYQATLFNVSGTTVTRTGLGTLGGTYSTGFGINNAGQVVGYSSTSSNSDRATLFNVNGTTVTRTDLGTLGGDSSYACGINDAGQVVGNSTTSDNRVHGFIYTIATRTRDINDLVGSHPIATDIRIHIDHSGDSKINNKGQIAAIGTVNGFTHALLLNPIKTPLVFIPGIAGSVLEGGVPKRELWPTVLPSSINALALAGGTDNVSAVDIVRQAYGEAFYSLFVNHFADSVFYKEFIINRDPTRLTSTYMIDYAVAHPEEPKPTFFPFPYDWRRSNAEHTAGLRQYIKRIKALHGGAKVDIVTHSMGGILMRRYFLDYPEDAASDVRKVVSVACPYWGAPKAVFRMLTGDFYDDKGGGIPDSINRDFMKIAYATLPGVHELLPTSAYFMAGGQSVLAEGSFDLDGNGLSYNFFSSTTYLTALDRQVRLLEPSIPLPSVNSINFHTGKQDSSSRDAADGIYVPILHLYGSQPKPLTTIRTRARSRTLLGYEVSVTGAPYFEQEYGLGDGTVPELSAARTEAFRASGAALTKVTDTNGARVDHNGIMQNEKVWDMIANFLDNGKAPGPVEDTTKVSSASRMRSATTTVSGRKKILVLGSGYVRIRDSEGNENTQLSEIAASKLPGIDIQYGGDSPWVTIECDTSREITIEAANPADAIELVVQNMNTNSSAQKLERYRFSPQAKAWKLELTASDSTTLSLDQNQNSMFEPNEAVSPTNTGNGTSIDVIQPKVTLELSRLNNQLVMQVSATDDGQAVPVVHYSFDEGAIQTYSGPIAVPVNEMHTLKVYAEDSMGNTSGLIQTAINPPLGIEVETGDIKLEWPLAEAYVLEETDNLAGTWHQSENLTTRTSLTMSVVIPSFQATKKFYRLRSQRTER